MRASNCQNPARTARFTLALAVPVAVLALASTSCQQVPYNPANSTDTTKPLVTIRVEASGAGLPNLVWEATNHTLPVTVVTATLSPQVVGTNTLFYALFDVMATVQDSESGVSGLGYDFGRYNYTADANGLDQEKNYEGARVIQNRSFPLTNGQAQALGVITRQYRITDLLTYRDGSGNTRMSDRAVVQFGSEGTNSAGLSDFSNPIKLVIERGNLFPNVPR